MGCFLNLKIVDFSKIFYSKPALTDPFPLPEVVGNALLGTSGSTRIITR